MDVMDETERLKKLWEKRVGKLPADFFLEISGDFLSLRFSGLRFRDLKEVGGEKPKEGSTSALICSHNICLSRLGIPIEEVVGFIQEHVIRTYEELSKP